MVDKIQFGRVAPISGQRPATVPSAPPSSTFSEVMESTLRKTDSVQFSAHATQRLREHGIALDRADMSRIQRAIDGAAAKGAEESLLLMDKLALVVSVSNRTVITAVPTNELEDRVFTNIDSAVVVAARPPLPPL